MGTDFAQDNTASRRRLGNLVRRLSDEDLAQTNSDGWTVAALLAHLAFWDGRVLALMRRWKSQAVDESPIDADAVNEALKRIFLALAPRTAVELSLSSAAAVDAELETLTPELIGQIEAQVASNPFQFRFNRALHRSGHLDEIESLLRRGDSSRELQSTQSG